MGAQVVVGEEARYAVHILGPTAFTAAVRNALGGRLVPVEPHEADVVVSDAETFSALSAEERRERVAGRLCVVISDRLDVDLVLGAYFAGWLALDEKQLVCVVTSAMGDAFPRNTLSMLLDRRRRNLQTIALADGEWSILRILVESWGECVAVDELAKVALARLDRAAVALVWKYISRLRLRLRSRSVEIESVPGRGYRIVERRSA